jgi:dihydrolipoamide dehydrogenase
MSKSYDVVVIGSGPGGYVAAIRASQLKLKTAIIEKDKLGGVCLNWGCIPTKALLKSADIMHELKHAKDFGITINEASHDFAKIIKRSRRVADMNSKGVDFLMKKNEIDVISGSGKIIDVNTVEITTADGEQETIKTKNIIISSGGRNKSIPGIEIDHEKIISAKEAMNLQEQPQSLLVIGGGAIGVEFSYFYNSIGTKVQIVEMLDHLLPGGDEEISEILEKNFKKQGIKTHTTTKLESLKTTENGIEAIVMKNGETQTITADKALIAIGISGNIENIFPENIGIETEKGFIKVDEWYKTAVDGIYAIGDVIGQPLLAHVASHEAIICIEKIAEVETHAFDYKNVPMCTYCQPQVASIGMSEKDALNKGHEIKIGRFPYSASGKARAIGARDGMVKVIFDKKYGELLGAHIIGHEATELIAELSVAKSLEATSRALAKIIHAHPTLSEMIMEAAADSDGEAIHI